MNSRVQTTLEYDKIKAMCMTHAASDVGREEISALAPVSAMEEAERLQQETQEAETVYRRTGRSPVDSFTDIRPMLRRIHASYSLCAGDLLTVAACLKASRRAKEVIEGTEGMTVLQFLANQLSSHRQFEEEIARCIISEDELADSASPELARLRRQIRLTNERIRDKLNSIIKGGSSKYLQEPIITVRNGRYAIPVKAEYRSQFPGLIHDSSGSGQTLFVEPTAVVELGNDFRRLQSLEKAEIERILSGLTAMLAPFAGELYNALGVLGRIDAIFARAIMARDMRAYRPLLNDDHRINLKNARHPLIDREKVVPVSIWIGDSFNTLIITGPNTGGKTVTLKTVGLFVLMALSGMYIPADEGSSVSVFNEVYADIGDEQSIEQSLSTFSSHMTNLVGILDCADEHSLVLLDELGAGTDPVEGAALAQAILEYISSLGALTMATTHYSEIKAFALTHKGMQNASMEFDVDRLCPTYRLYIGIPGKSNAFEISARLGLNPDVIERAKHFVKKEDVAFEDVLKEASEQRRLAVLAAEQAEEERYASEQIRITLDGERRKLRDERQQIRQKAKDEARDVVKAAKREMEQLITELREVKNIDTRELDRAIMKSRDRMRETESLLCDGLEPKEDNGTAPNTVRPGETVRILSIGGNGTVLKAPDQKGMVQVQAGIMKISVPLSDLRAPDRKEELKKARGERPILQDIKEVRLELDIRGQTIADAMLEIDRYIDDCGLSGRKEFNIIHGKGTGALRAGVQAYLKNHPKVKSFRMGAYGEGDAGVTVVTLK